MLGPLLVLGCVAVGPNFTRPEVTVNPRWSPEGDPRIATQVAADALWWKAFNDPALDRLVELAYRQNLPLQIAGLRIVQARAALGVATGRQFPQIQTAFAALTETRLSKANIFVNGLQAPIGNQSGIFTNYQVGFDAIWELDFWGKYRRGVEAEAASVLASVGDYNSALVSLTAEVARTYVAIRTFEVLLVQAHENERIQQDGLLIARSRFNAGAATELDVTQATSLLETTRASIPQLQSGLQQARNALSTLLGRPPGKIDELLGGPADIPQAPPRVAVGVPAEMLRRRPDIRAAELLAAAQCARIGVAKADLYPSFLLFGTIGLQTVSGGGAHFSFNPNTAGFWAVSPRIVWPFFSYGRVENGVRVVDALFEQALVSYRNTVLRAAQEVEDGLAGYLYAQQAVQHVQAAVAAAQRSVKLALVQYREGATDYQRVLDSQRSLLQLQGNFTQTRSSVATSLIALYKALGGGWESRVGQPVVPKPIVEEMKHRTNWGDLLEPDEPGTAKPSVPAQR